MRECSMKRRRVYFVILAAAFTNCLAAGQCFLFLPLSWASRLIRRNKLRAKKMQNSSREPRQKRKCFACFTAANSTNAVKEFVYIENRALKSPKKNLRCKLGALGRGECFLPPPPLPENGFGGEPRLARVSARANDSKVSGIHRTVRTSRPSLRALLSLSLSSVIIYYTKHTAQHP